MVGDRGKKGIFLLHRQQSILLFPWNPKIITKEGVQPRWDTVL